MKWFKKDDNKKNIERNKKKTGDDIRIRVWRLENETYVELSGSPFIASLEKDESHNTIILNEDKDFKEEFPGLHDPLVSDILYKLESSQLSREGQIKKVNDAITKQNKILAEEKNGKVPEKDNEGNIVNDDNGKPKYKKVNKITEEHKLRLLKCAKYALENMKGSRGIFEKIESDGMRTLEYLVQDGNLYPFWHKTPMTEGEPVILVPDVVQRKKFWKESTEEALDDYNASQNTMWAKILGIAKGALFVVLVIGVTFMLFRNISWSQELYTESCQDEVKSLEMQIANTKKQCVQSISSQVDNNQALIDYAKEQLKQKNKSQSQNKKSDIEI